MLHLFRGTIVLIPLATFCIVYFHQNKFSFFLELLLLPLHWHIQLFNRSDLISSCKLRDERYKCNNYDGHFRPLYLCIQHTFLFQWLRRRSTVFSPFVPSPLLSFPASLSPLAISSSLFPKLIRSFPRLWAGSYSSLPQSQRNEGGYSGDRWKLNTIHTRGKQSGDKRIFENVRR